MKITKSESRPTGDCWSTTMTFEVESKDQPNVEEVAVLAGYHPEGYGMYRSEVKKIKGNKWKVSWQRANSCD